MAPSIASDNGFGLILLEFPPPSSSQVSTNSIGARSRCSLAPSNPLSPNTRVHCEMSPELSGGGCATLTDIYNAQSGQGSLQVLSSADSSSGGTGSPTGYWFLADNIFVYDDVVLFVEGKDRGGDCDVLRIEVFTATTKTSRRDVLADPRALRTVHLPCGSKVGESVADSCEITSTSKNNRQQLTTQKSGFRDD